MSRVNPGVKLNLLEKNGYRCAVCRATALPKLVKDEQGFRVFDTNGKITDKTITVDHIVPKSKGGTNRKINLIVLCNHCNGAKADRDPIEWLDSLDPKVRRSIRRFITPAVSFHRKILGKSVCDNCLEDLSAFYRNRIRRSNMYFLDKNMKNFFVKFLVFFMIIAPLWCFRVIMKLTGEWENFIGKKEKKKKACHEKCN